MPKRKRAYAPYEARCFVKELFITGHIPVTSGHSQLPVVSSENANGSDEDYCNTSVGACCHSVYGL